ncbi:MAG: hypothetical protein QOG48_399 [Verrucomicrobiota bacterium]|jgi:hypothetical protein
MSILRVAGAVLFVVAAYSLGAADEKIDVAKIIDKAAAEAILGSDVKDPTPINVEGKDGYYSKCNYYSADAGKLLILRVYQAAAGYDASKELDHVHATSGLTKIFSGIGDKAEIASGAGSGLGDNVSMLYVVKGTTLVTVGLRGFDEDAAAEKMKTVAQKILEHL